MTWSPAVSRLPTWWARRWGRWAAAAVVDRAWPRERASTATPSVPRSTPCAPAWPYNGDPGRPRLMSLLRRLRGREDHRSPAMATSLDVGTEYVKALVFRIEDGAGSVVGAGRHRQGLGQMQAATVTDIAGVVEN